MPDPNFGVPTALPAAVGDTTNWLGSMLARGISRVVDTELDVYATRRGIENQGPLTFAPSPGVAAPAGQPAAVTAVSTRTMWIAGAAAAALLIVVLVARR